MNKQKLYGFLTAIVAAVLVVLLGIVSLPFIFGLDVTQGLNQRLFYSIFQPGVFLLFILVTTLVGKNNKEYVKAFLICSLIFFIIICGIIFLYNPMYHYGPYFTDWILS